MFIDVYHVNATSVSHANQDFFKGIDILIVGESCRELLLQRSPECVDPHPARMLPMFEAGVIRTYLRVGIRRTILLFVELNPQCIDVRKPSSQPCSCESGIETCLVVSDCHS